MGQKITIRKAAERLNMGDKAVRNLIARGDLPAYQVGTTRNLRVDTDDLDNLYRPIPTGGRRKNQNHNIKSHITKPSTSQSSLPTAKGGNDRQKARHRRA